MVGHPSDAPGFMPGRIAHDDLLNETQGPPGRERSPRRPENAGAVGGAGASKGSGRGAPLNFVLDDSDPSVLSRFSKLLNNVGSSNMAAIPKFVKQLVARRLNKYKQAVGTWLRSKKHLEKLQSEFDDYQSDPSSIMYPKGVRPFKSPATIAELEDKWSLASGDSHQFVVMIPSGSSRREAMRLIHHSAFKQIKSIEVEAYTAAERNKWASAEPSTLDDAPRGIFSEYCASDHLSSLGLMAPESNLSVAHVQRYLLSEYPKIYSALNAMVTKQLSEKVVSSVPAINAAQPETLFEDAVGLLVAKKLKTLGLDHFDEQMDAEGQ